MSKINDILSELGVSKVRLAKYLGVSRQMLYNYLSCDNLEDWPSEKATRLMQLLEIKSAKEIDDIKIDGDYIIKVDNKLRNCVIELHSISKDKALQKRAKDNLYYDKAKDEKNKFNIITRQMLVEQNYEYLSKFGRKIIVSKYSP